MANVKVTLKDGSVKEVAAGTTLLEVAKGLSQKLGKQALLAVVDGVNKDLTDKLEHDASVEFVVPESSEGLHAIRHTAAHIMAQAIQHLFPDTKFAIGPAIANGFYYDLDSEHVFVPEDLIAIEKEMAKIVKANLQKDRWLELEFDFSSVKDRKDYDKIVIQFGGEGHAAPGIFFFDDFSFNK